MTRTFLLAAALSLGACATSPGVDRLGEASPILSDTLVGEEGRTPYYVGYEGALRPVTGPVALEVTLDPRLAYLANNPGQRGGSAARLNSGFATGGYLGEKDVLELLDRTQRELAEELTKEGIRLDPSAGNVLQVTLADARPSRPTFTQLAREPGLSARSLGEGGASFEGVLLTADGQSLPFTYGYYSNDIGLPGAGAAGIWGDTRRAIGRMADRVAKELEE